MVVKATEDPPLVNGAERAVWDALSAQLGEFDFVAANQRISNHDKDHEIDFVVAIDGLGVACLEVKGGQVWHDGSTWVQSRGGRDHQIDPVRQVLNATYALREYVESDARWTQGRVPWVHLLVLPNTELTADFCQWTSESARGRTGKVPVGGHGELPSGGHESAQSGVSATGRASWCQVRGVTP